MHLVEISSLNLTLPKRVKIMYKPMLMMNKMVRVHKKKVLPWNTFSLKLKPVTLNLFIFFKDSLNIIRCNPAIGFVTYKYNRSKAAGSDAPETRQ